MTDIKKQKTTIRNHAQKYVKNVLGANIKSCSIESHTHYHITNNNRVS